MKRLYWCYVTDTLIGLPRLPCTTEWPWTDDV